MTVESSSESQDAIENLFDERRTFPPDPAFVAQANAKPDLYEAAERARKRPEYAEHETNLNTFHEQAIRATAGNPRRGR